MPSHGPYQYLSKHLHKIDWTFLVKSILQNKDLFECEFVNEQTYSSKICKSRSYSLFSVPLMRFIKTFRLQEPSSVIPPICCLKKIELDQVDQGLKLSLEHLQERRLHTGHLLVFDQPHGKFIFFLIPDQNCPYSIPVASHPTAVHLWEVWLHFSVSSVNNKKSPLSLLFSMLNWLSSLNLSMCSMELHVGLCSSPLTILEASSGLTPVCQ